MHKQRGACSRREHAFLIYHIEGVYPGALSHATYPFYVPQLLPLKHENLAARLLQRSSYSLFSPFQRGAHML